MSYETDPNWAIQIQGQAPAHVRVVHYQSLDETVEAASIAKDEAFDIIIIDAGNRIRVAKNILAQGEVVLSSGGCIIWDNTDGPDWPEIRELISNHGFRELSFVGLVPQEVHFSRTTVFYRRDNVLGI